MRTHSLIDLLIFLFSNFVCETSLRPFLPFPSHVLTLFLPYHSATEINTSLFLHPPPIGFLRAMFLPLPHLLLQLSLLPFLPLLPFPSPRPLLQLESKISVLFFSPRMRITLPILKFSRNPKLLISLSPFLRLSKS